MHKETMYFGDHNKAERIMCSSNVRQQKSLGRKVRHFDVNNRVSVKLSSKLLVTVGTILVEAIFDSLQKILTYFILYVVL